MSAVLLPLADHGGVVNFLPFVAPMVLVLAGLAFLMLRDRLGSRREEGDDRASSQP